MIEVKVSSNTETMEVKVSLNTGKMEVKLSFAPALFN